MKNIFMPSMDELYKMQEMGANVYKYMYIKAIEALICNGLNYPSEGILKNAHKYLQEDIELARAICTLYPDEMAYSKVSSTDFELCKRLMNYKEYSPCGLDNLCKFNADITSNPTILKHAIIMLAEELSNNPKYRFEYVGSELRYAKRNAGNLLDDIFARKISEDELMFILGKDRGEVIKALTLIEPTYSISLSDSYVAEKNKFEYLCIGINEYAARYGLSSELGYEYYGKDILTNPDRNVKRLIKCINDRNK